MEKRCICFLFLFLIVPFGGIEALAGEEGFYDTAPGIEAALSRPKVRTRGLTRSFSAGPAPKTRTIVVLAREKESEVSKTIVVPVDDPGNSVNMKIQFDYNSSVLKPDAYKLLAELGRAVTGPGLQDKTITIIGHTDSDGPEAYNLRLSLRRAEAVKNFLAGSYNVSQGRLAVYGYGETMPLFSNDAPMNKQKNRRVELRAD